MPTVCELKIQAKAKGLRGYSKLKKADLEKLVGGKSSPKKEASPKKADPNKAIPLPPPPAKKKEKKKPAPKKASPPKKKPSPKKPDPPSSPPPPSESAAAPADDYAELMKEIEETHALNTAGKGSKAMNSYPVQSSKYKKLNAAKNKANKALITAINDHRKSEGNSGIKFKDIRMSGVPYFVRMAKKYGVPFATTEKIFRSYMRTQF